MKKLDFQKYLEKAKMKKWALYYRYFNSETIVWRGFHNVHEAENFIVDLIRSGGQLHELKHDGKKSSVPMEIAFNMRVNQKLRANQYTTSLS